MRILFLSSWFPYPPNNGSKIRIYNLLRGLSKYHEITLLSFLDQRDTAPDFTNLNSICREIHAVPWKPFQPHSFRAQLGFLKSTPRSISDTFSIEMAGLIRETFSLQDFDLVIASGLGTACYNQYFPRIPALFEEVEVGVSFERFANASSAWKRLRYGLTWTKHRSYLTHLLQGYDACTVVSERERQLLTQAVPDYKTIEVIPNCISLADYDLVRQDPRPHSLVFTGSFRYSANYDAMVWFLEEIYPRIQEQMADVHLTITGDHCALPLPTGTNVELTGLVDDIRPIITSSSVSIAPIRIGGGTRLKILEAMALSTPVVATSKGAEGLEIQNGKHLLIADTPETFSEMVIRLLRDQELHQQIGMDAHSLVIQKYDWAVVLPRFLSLVDRITQS